MSSLLHHSWTSDAIHVHLYNICRNRVDVIMWKRTLVLHHIMFKSVVDKVCIRCPVVVVYVAPGWILLTIICKSFSVRLSTGKSLIMMWFVVLCTSPTIQIFWPLGCLLWHVTRLLNDSSTSTIPDSAAVYWPHVSGNTAMCIHQARVLSWSVWHQYHTDCTS